MAGDYSGDDILRMQQDAARRVREMQARSRFAVEHTPRAVRPEAERNSQQPQKAEQCVEEKTNKSAATACAANASPPAGSLQQGFLPFPIGKKGGILEALHTNSDTVLLMALLFVLYTEQADELLMFAVLYIML